MISSEVLQSLGIHLGLLSIDERSFLDESGYLFLNGILTEDEVMYLRYRLDELAEIEGNAAGSAPHQEEGTVQLNCLIRILYSRSLSSLRVFQLVFIHVIGPDIQLSSLSSRTVLPNGQGPQGLHTDWRETVEFGIYFVCNAALQRQSQSDRLETP